MTAWQLVGSICTTDSAAGPEKLQSRQLSHSRAGDEMFTKLEQKVHILYKKFTFTNIFQIYIKFCNLKNFDQNFNNFLLVRLSVTSISRRSLKTKR